MQAFLLIIMKDVELKDFIFHFVSKILIKNNQTRFIGCICQIYISFHVKPLKLWCVRVCGCQH